MEWSRIVPFLVLGALSVVLGAVRLRRGRGAAPGFLEYLWTFLGVLLVAEWLSFPAAVWLFAFLSFLALREYFSLVDLRLEDRWGVLGAYLAIPFMFYLVAIHWYGFFIVSIPVYVFLVIPFLVALGDPAGRGSVLSIGAIDFGLFLLVYCLGHLAYLARYSAWTALFLVLAVAACGAAAGATRARGRAIGLLLGLAASLALAIGLRAWTGMPISTAVFAGVLIPVLVQVGDFTIGVLERDLGIRTDDLEPGRGRIFHSLQAYLFAAPIVFHYLRWDLGWK
ncbi:MAG: hypothetical protein AB1726_18825 [Planctomycetota bacterium]